MSVPMARQAVGDVNNGICSWLPDAKIPCTGDFYSMNVKEPVTGCAIIQGNTVENPGPITVFGSGSLGFANTGYIETYSQGQTVPISIEIGTYHGGIFQFRIQDVGSNDDPDGTLWETLPVLTVESFQPTCDDVAQCGIEPCVADKTCASIPLNAYGEHNFHHTMMVKLPDDLRCEHCVLQWNYMSSNSCPEVGDSGRLACPTSEQFWNCADINIVAGDSPITSPVATPVTSPVASPVGSPVATPVATPVASPVTSPSSPIPPLPWNEDCFCQFQTGCTIDADCCSGQHCADIDADGLFQHRICLENPVYHTASEMPTGCKRTVTSPTLEASDFGCTSDADCCNPSAQCTFRGVCEFPQTCKVFGNSPVTTSPSESPITAPSESPSSESPITPSVENCPEGSCYAILESPTSWYTFLLDDWCNADCTGNVVDFPERCATGCRGEISILQTHTQSTGTDSELSLSKSMNQVNKLVNDVSWFMSAFIMKVNPKSDRSRL